MAVFLAPLAWNAARIGATWAVRRWAQRGAVAVVENALPATVTIGGAAAINQMMEGANEEADNTLSPAAADTACAICRRNSPCRHLAAGVPGAQYRGGAHGDMQLPYGDGLESHHTPANSVNGLPAPMGPAIQMDPADHALTASHTRMPGSAAYRAEQGQLIASGNFLGATAMDVENIRELFGDKYDGAIAQMSAYTECLRRNGLIR